MRIFIALLDVVLAGGSDVSSLLCEVDLYCAQPRGMARRVVHGNALEEFVVKFSESLLGQIYIVAKVDTKISSIG